MDNKTVIALHTRCLLAKLGTGKPIGFHVQAILRNLSHPSVRLPRIGTHSLN